MKKEKKPVFLQDSHQVVGTEERCEQPRAELTLKAVYDRVEFPPVQQLEELAKVGFVCERLQCSELSSPLYRLAIEHNRGDVEQMPKGLTPWMTAQDLSVALTGVMYLQPLCVREIKAYQADAPKND